MRPPPLFTAAKISLACLDLTSLNDNDDEAAIRSLCARADGPFGKVAAVCVWPRFTKLARQLLDPAIHVAAVANFPLGGTNVDSAVQDTRAIVQAGAQEVDVVLPYRALMRGDEAACVRLLQAVRSACTGLTLKVILETGELQDSVLIGLASQTAIDCGADFIKTSTGKSKISATLEAARTMMETIAMQAPPAHARVGFKASGGIRTVAEASHYIALAQSIMGKEAVNASRFRFGASGLLSDIEAVLGGKITTASNSGY
jgi:deoxyribose-phosphate aldolase